MDAGTELLRSAESTFRTIGLAHEELRVILLALFAAQALTLARADLTKYPHASKFAALFLCVGFYVAFGLPGYGLVAIGTAVLYGTASAHRPAATKTRVHVGAVAFVGTTAVLPTLLGLLAGLCLGMGMAGAGSVWGIGFELLVYAVAALHFAHLLGPLVLPFLIGGDSIRRRVVHPASLGILAYYSLLY